MCGKGSGITSPAQWKGKTLGVTDIGSGTDNLTEYLAARSHLTTKDYTRAGVGDGPTFVAALQNHRIACGMTTQPTVNAIEKQGIGTSVINLASTSGAQQWMGGTYPAAGVLARADWVAANQATVQKVVDAMVATMRWMSTHTAADVANKMPPSFVSNGLTTKADYISALAADKGQFLPDGMMPANGPATALAVDKLAGNVTKPVNIPVTYTNKYAIAANKLEGFTK
jgi:NitT/TauT family transport system substrate-binding protein